MTGLCQCGCGERTIVSPHTDRWHGWEKGVPRRFLPGHNGKLNANVPVVEDHGYVTPCAIWKGAVNHAGYPRAIRDGRSQRIHRWAWEQVHGPIPEGLELDHLCRQRACVRVDHLEPVTHQENMRRAAAAMRSSDTTGIRAFRLAAKWSQTELAERLGCSRSLVARWETGKTRITPKFQARLRELADGNIHTGLKAVGA